MFQINQQLLQAIINYLIERPYKETAGLLQTLGALKPIDEKKEVKKEEITKIK